MCEICKKGKGDYTVEISTESGKVKLIVCLSCLMISEEYYLVLCQNCRTKSWSLANSTETENGELKGKRFTVLYVDDCISCHGYSFHKA